MKARREHFNVELVIYIFNSSSGAGDRIRRQNSVDMKRQMSCTDNDIPYSLC